MYANDMEPITQLPRSSRLDLSHVRRAVEQVINNSR